MRSLSCQRTLSTAQEMQGPSIISVFFEDSPDKRRSVLRFPPSNFDLAQREMGGAVDSYVRCPVLFKTKLSPDKLVQGKLLDGTSFSTTAPFAWHTYAIPPSAPCQRFVKKRTVFLGCAIFTAFLGRLVLEGLHRRANGVEDHCLSKLSAQCSPKPITVPRAP